MREAKWTNVSDGERAIRRTLINSPRCRRKAKWKQIFASFQSQPAPFPSRASKKIKRRKEKRNDANIGVSDANILTISAPCWPWVVSHSCMAAPPSKLCLRDERRSDRSSCAVDWGQRRLRAGRAYRALTVRLGCGCSELRAWEKKKPWGYTRNGRTAIIANSRNAVGVSAILQPVFCKRQWRGISRK